ncbi:YbaB/EbfC family nucleoid-associated protein [Saccharothrix australiensis]|uniref:YbaB/EbfC DNA-binding family protein n=1 Tax=Saccharothrix australiensis TaxID=2072 RepID=A0A495W0W8_9PSEU|nr:YbaB/EbfC family nucleoid-associated protein [Saccharothrix australiensis]RKT54760.1 YbaB/EbfC DNA-binding family protein [Saccharothrix australiensis]
MPDRRARLDDAIRSFQEQAGKVAQLKDKLAELRGQARSADGSVTVTVAPSGAVLGLQLTPNAMRLSHTQLQQEILSTIRQATQHAAQALQDTVGPVLGDRAAQFSEAFNAHSPIQPLGPDAPGTPPGAPAAPPPGAHAGPPAGARVAPPAGPPQPAWQQNRPPVPQVTRNRPAAPEVGDDDEGFGSILR